MPVEPTYFESAAALKRWFSKNAGSAQELVLGFMKVSSGSASVSWPEAVDEALCVGWIDGVRHRIDEARYKIRFTPRKPGSHWSAVNIKRVAELDAEGRMRPAGRAAFAQRTEARSKIASYEQAAMPELSDAEVAQFKQTAGAWGFYQALPASYKKKLTWWVVSAKQQATRSNRLAQWVEACAREKRL
jgi:uncharacterized protein YdeI (YjbR/CyaY-like superfamily)